ncbi:14298_t:CDS:2, partial [Acaulospora colombiana]
VAWGVNYWSLEVMVRVYFAVDATIDVREEGLLAKLLGNLFQDDLARPDSGVNEDSSVLCCIAVGFGLLGATVPDIGSGRRANRLKPKTRHATGHYVTDQQFYLGISLAFTPPPTDRRFPHSPGSETMHPQDTTSENVFNILKVVCVPTVANSSDSDSCLILVFLVLDTQSGKPAVGVEVIISRAEGNGTSFSAMATGTTDADGRCTTLLPPQTLSAGIYKMTFATKAYFAETNRDTFFPAVEHPEQHYHIPLLLSPFSYTTYRGS